MRRCAPSRLLRVVATEGQSWYCKLLLQKVYRSILWQDDMVCVQGSLLSTRTCSTPGRCTILDAEIKNIYICPLLICDIVGIKSTSLMSILIASLQGCMRRGSPMNISCYVSSITLSVCVVTCHKVLFHMNGRLFLHRISKKAMLFGVVVVFLFAPLLLLQMALLRILVKSFCKFLQFWYAAPPFTVLKNHYQIYSCITLFWYPRCICWS